MPAKRVTVVVACVCVCVRSNLPLHTLDQRIHCNIGSFFNFGDFAKNASFKSYGIIYSL